MRLLAASCLAFALFLATACDEAPDTRPPGPVTWRDHTPEEWLKRLHSANAHTRRQAAEALSHYADDQATLPGLIALVENRQAGMARLEATRALGGLGAKAAPAVPALITALGDSSWDGRDGAAEALGNIRGQEAQSAPALVAALNDPHDPILRRSCARALGRLRSDAPEAIDGLAAALGDVDTNVQAEAALALASIGPPARKAVPALEKAAKSETFVVAQAAQQALAAIRGQ